MGRVYGFPNPDKYFIHKLIYDILSNNDLRNEFKKDPVSVMKKYGLGAKDMEVLLRGDMVEMYNYGIHPYAIHPYWRSILGNEDKPTDVQRIYREV
jgi:hypothetical protein